MKLNENNTQTFEEYVFATLLDVFAVDYSCQVTFNDTWLDHYGVGRFRVDFVIPSHSLVVEIDGASHKTWRQKRIDKMRDEYLTAHGFKVIRIKNEELQEDEIRQVSSRIWHLVFGDE